MERGQIVKSLAGRDAGEWFAVVSAGEDFALLANGRERPLERPKKKRRKHLALTAGALDEEALRSNRSLRAALSCFCEPCDEGGK